MLNIASSKGRVTYRFLHAMCHKDTNKMTPTTYHMHHSQNFDKIDSFLKPALNIFILCNLIVGWGRRLLKRGLVFCIKSIDFGEVLIVAGSRIHQSKSWYYLGPFQSSKVKLFAKIVFNCKPLHALF